METTNGTGDPDVGMAASSSSSSSTADDSDCTSVLSAVFDQRWRPQNDDGRGTVFTYDIPPRPPSAAAGVLASSVYVLIDEGQSMSADLRLMWYLKRLGTVQTVDDQLGVRSPELCRIMSFVPREDSVINDDTYDGSTFVMDVSTIVYFLTAVCNMVYCLDMSPSNCSVDVQRGYVMLDEMIEALKQSIEGFVAPFIVPGSSEILFEPQVYVTVIVHTPFYTSLAQQVLVQGWLINNYNYKEFIRTVTSEMNRLENALAKTKIIVRKNQNSDDDDDDYYNNSYGNEYAIKMYNYQNRKLSNNNNSMSSHTSSKSRHNNENDNDENETPIANNSPDSGFINTLRYGMLAVRLLPPSSISNLIVITDGMITLADIQVLDSVLNQLRCIGVACSFLHVSSQFHPHSGHGLVPYSELMQLISTATCGFYLNEFPKTTHDKVVNLYHDKFIMWSFKRGNDEYSNNTTNLSCTPTRVRSGEWTVRNSNFYGNRQTQLVSKKQINDQLHANLDNIVCCRMREGFIIEDIQLKDAGSTTPVLNMSNSSELQLKFILPWTNHIYIEYDLMMKWPPSAVSKTEVLAVHKTAEIQVPSPLIPQSTELPEPLELDNTENIYYSITVKGPYEFLHDITCNRGKNSQLLTQLAPKFQFHLSSCRSSSVSVTASTTTITKNNDLMPGESSPNNHRIVTSKYRQALIARFWSTMRSIVQADLLIKHLETYSSSTGHLTKHELRQQNENHERQQPPPALDNQQSPQIQQTDESTSSPSPNSTNTSVSKIDTSVSTVVTEAKSGNVLIPGVPNRSPLRNGIPLFYHPPTNTNTPPALKQSQVRLNDQQGYDLQHQQFVDFWRPVCTLDPDSQWPKWFSTYRIGDGILVLKHDRPLPTWLHMSNPINNRYQTLSSREAFDALFDLLKQWCSFILIDDHSYVKCLDESETQTGNVSFCIAQISVKSPSCCCVVLHLAFQSCVPVCVHLKIINDLKKSIQLLDSTTAVKPATAIDNENSICNNEENENEKQEKPCNEPENCEQITRKKSTSLQKYIYILDKPLEKILIRYERIPSQFTTVIFPDGSKPYPAPAITTSNIIKPNPKLGIKKHITSQEIPTGIELKTVTTTTTLSRYLYHRRWIWSSGYKRYSKFNNTPQKLQIQLARTLSVLTNIRLREGFKFAHSSAGVISMVLKVDMIEGSPFCPSTPTSHCVIQYVLFPPNIPHKHRLKDHIDILKKKNNEDERSSTSSFDELQQFEKRQKHGRNTITSDYGDNNYCCSQDNADDDYQLITECWIEPQHGKVVANKNLNINYMSGLMYEQLADAIWQVDSDCINSLYTFEHMQDMCMDHEVLVSYPDFDTCKSEQNKTVVVDAGRIYKFPFSFNLANLLPKSRHHSSMTYSLFTLCDDCDSDDNINTARDDKQLNLMLERSFYLRMRTINDRSFDVDNSNSTTDLNQMITKVNNQDIGQCFIKRVDDTRLILTVAPSYGEKKYNSTNDNSTEDDFQPLNRSRANTWHHTKRNAGLLCPQSLENSKHYYRTMSVGSKPLNTIETSLDELKLDYNVWTSDINDIQNECTSDSDNNLQEFPINVFIEVYDCRQEDIENVLMFDNYSNDQSVNDYIEDESSSCSSTATKSDKNKECNPFISKKNKMNFEEPDPLLIEKYLQNIRVVFNQSFVTTVFHALHLGLNVPYIDIQRAIDHCQYRLVTFEITNYIKVVCDHFKKNANSTICPTDNTTLKSHHDMINTTFSSILDRHMLKSVDNHPDYFFYDFIERYGYDDDSDGSYYTSNELSVDGNKNKYIPKILLGKPHKTNLDSYEVDEQDLFPLFVQLMCTVKTNKITRSQVVRSLPTCIIELMSQNNENESTRNMNLSDLKVSLDVYCLILPNNYYDDNDDDGEDINTFNKGNSSEQLHFPIHSSSTTLTLTKQIESFEKLFLYLSASLPTRHAQGLAAFIAEVDWCMRDEMAAGLLKDPIVTPETLNKVIEHVTNSPSSSANHQQNLVMHFVPSPGPSKYSSVSLFLQRLDQLEIILDIGNDNIDRLYTLAKSTNDTFYVVKKDMPLSTNNEAWSNNRKYSKPMLPNFWLVLKIQEDQQYQKENNSNHNTKVNTLIVNVYFHCRFTELDLEGRYSAVREAVGLNIRQAATIVNQTFLLWRLHDTRICDPLLEPVNNEDLSNTDEDDNDKEEIEKIKKYFTLGQFKCPIVWSTRFSLNPRIRHSTNLLVFGGAHVLNPVLDKFSIRNRRNMFSYRESKTGSVFYLKLYECSNQPHQKFNLVDPSLQSDSEDDTISRCSSATSTTATISSSINPSNNLYASRKYSEDLNYMDNKFIQTPGVRSLGGYYPDTDSKTVEYLTLNVHGISPAGNEIRIDLVGVLQNRLNDAVLEVLTTMLYRNPACRLYPDDVRFIQPVGGDVDFTSQLSLPIETKITKYFARNLKRNAATLSLYSPKYVSRHQKFNYTYDALNTTKPVIRSYFIYNYPCFGNTGTGGIRPYSGKRGLACVLYDIYSNEDHLIDDLLYDYPTDIDLFKKRVEVTCIEDNMRSTTDHSGYVKLFVWCRGRVLIEPLQKKMTSIVTYSLWDSYVERYFCEHPIIIEEPNEAYMNPLCIQFLTKWIAFGAHLGVPLAHHSEIQCRIHMDHVLREFKTHLSWSGTFTSNKVTTLSVRYFYVPNTQYGQSTADCGCTNIISDSPDPLQLKQKQNELLLNNLIFYEWNISNIDSVICPPSAACVLIVVTVTSKKKTRQRRKRSQNQNKDIELSDSDSDNGVIVPEDEENVKSEEDKIKTLISNDQIMVPSNTSNDDVKQDSITHSKMHQKENSMNNRNKVNKLSLLAISGQSVHILSYNCYDNDDQAITVNHLSNWLELRRTAFDLSIFSMMGLKSAQKSNEVIGSRINNYSKIKNNPDLLLDYKNYVAVMGEHESHQKVNNDKSNRQNKNTQKRNCAKSTDKNMDDKKNKSLIYKRDFNDLFIEQLVKNHKLQCRTEINQKILYDMWTQVDTVVTKDTLRVFYNHSRLLHYCLTPLLFLPQWRFESAATRDHLVDANKTRNVPSPPPPQWHKRLCTQLTNAYANYIETNSLFSGFQSVHVNRSRSYCDGVALEIDNNKPTTRYYKKSVPGEAGGILVLETGVCQPFYYVKLSCVERNMIVNHLDKPQSPLTLLDESENIIRNMHLHSFTYDFHIRVLSDKLNKLLQKQKSGKKNLSILLESKISAQSSTNKAESVSNKNAIAGFLDDFLKYYTLPPLYSNCLVLAGIIKRTQISVTGIQLYEYILGNCSEDCNNMAVIKICDSALVDGDDGASLFDDNNENNNYFENQNSLGNDLSDFIIVHRMTGSDIKRRQKSEMNSYLSKLGIEANDVFTDCQFEIYGLKDATLVMTLSSVKEVSSDTSNEITLSYYVLLTNNDNNTLQKMEKTSFRGGCNIQQTLNRFHYSPSHRFELGDNLLVSASVPSNSFGNVLSFGSPTCWGSLGENNADSPINTSPESKNKSEKNFNSHHQQMIKKRSLIKFYEKKAAELVAHTVDTAANRCCTHLLWKKFAIQLDLSKSGPSNITSSELEDLIHKSGHVISLAAYDRRLRPVIEELSQNPLWFNSLHKLICNPTPFASTISLRCRIFNSNNSEQQYLVVLPKKSNIMNINVFIIIDNGVVSPGRAAPTPDSLMNIVFRRNAVCSEEVFPLVESIGKAICYYIWHSVITGSVSNTTFHI